MFIQLIIIIKGCYSLKIILWHSRFIYIPTQNLIFFPISNLWFVVLMTFKSKFIFKFDLNFKYRNNLRKSDCIQRQISK